MGDINNKQVKFLEYHKMMIIMDKNKAWNGVLGVAEKLCVWAHVCIWVGVFGVCV